MKDLNREQPPGGRLLALGALALALLAAAVAVAAAASLPSRQAVQAAGGGQAAEQGQAAEGEADGTGDVPSDPAAAPEGDGEPAETTAASPSRGRAWAESIAGGESLAALTDADLDALYGDAYDYLGTTAQGDAAALECAAGPRDAADPYDAVLYLKVAGTRTYLECSRLADGSGWDVVQLMRTVGGVNDEAEALVEEGGTVDLGDATSLRALLGEDAGGSLLSQLRQWVQQGGEASPGISMLVASSVQQTASGLTCTIAYGVSDASEPAAVENHASWDASSGTWSFEYAPAQ